MSKYDEFWDLIRNELEAAIQKSLQTRSKATLKLSGLTEQGRRATWYAKGVIGSHNPDNMAHGTALANCLTAYARDKRLTIDYTVPKDGREVQLMASLAIPFPQNQLEHTSRAQIKSPAVSKKPPSPQVSMTTKNSPVHDQQNQETKTMKKLEGRTLLILPCCESKKANVPYPNPLPPTPPKFIRALGRIAPFRPCVRMGPKEAPALWLYTGHLYNRLDRAILNNEMAAGWLDIVILSGGYGMVHAYEKIHDYEAEMPTYYDRWIRAGLPTALENYINDTKPNNVIAFFSNHANQKKSYGGIYCQGVGQTTVLGERGKYVPPAIPGSAIANRDLGKLVMEVVINKSRIDNMGIPFHDPCWFQP